MPTEPSAMPAGVGELSESEGGASAGESAAWLSRNAVDCLPEGGLEAKLASGRPLRIKLGIDPTAPDIHLGFTVVLQKLREFQDLGHTVVLIIGDYTARVGDPSGRSSTRPVLEPAAIDANAATFQAQAMSVLDPDRLEVRFNGEWLDMSAADLFALMRTATVARILERDDFSKRYGAGEPISILELLYPLLQGYDSVAIRADVELGGTDQKFNLQCGRDLQRHYGQRPQIILMTPILEGLDGVQKMSKSLNNAIGINEPPAEMYGKLMSISDELMWKYWVFLTDLRLSEVAGLQLQVANGKLHPMDAKKQLARTITAGFHGEEAAASADENWARMFQQKGESGDLEEVAVAYADVAGPEPNQIRLPKLLVQLALAASGAEASRKIAEKAVKLDGEVAGNALVPLAALPARLVVRLGKRAKVAVVT
jgi:tyrosyl-tRNA synthetase